MEKKRGGNSSVQLKVSGVGNKVWYLWKRNNWILFSGSLVHFEPGAGAALHPAGSVRGIRGYSNPLRPACQEAGIQDIIISTTRAQRSWECQKFYEEGKRHMKLGAK